MKELSEELPLEEFLQSLEKLGVANTANSPTQFSGHKKNSDTRFPLLTDPEKPSKTNTLRSLSKESCNETLGFGPVLQAFDSSWSSSAVTNYIDRGETNEDSGSIKKSEHSECSPDEHESNCRRLSLNEANLLMWVDQDSCLEHRDKISLGDLEADLELSQEETSSFQLTPNPSQCGIMKEPEALSTSSETIMSGKKVVQQADEVMELFKLFHQNLHMQYEHLYKKKRCRETKSIDQASLIEENKILKLEVEKLTARINDLQKEKTGINSFSQREQRMKERFQEQSEKMKRKYERTLSKFTKKLELSHQKLKEMELEKSLMEDQLRQKQKEINRMKKERNPKNRTTSNIATYSSTLKEPVVKRLVANLGALKLEHQEFSRNTMATLSSMNKHIAQSFSRLLRRVQSVTINEKEFIKKIYSQVAKERLTLFKRIQDLQENVRVFCRIRPLSNREVFEGQRFHPMVEDENTLRLKVANTEHKFKFDKVFHEKSTQQDVFLELAPFVIPVMKSSNACIFGYGQRRSGKTYTLGGNPENEGLSFTLIRELFKLKELWKEEFSYNFLLSICEVHEDKVIDLQTQSNSAKFCTLEDLGYVELQSPIEAAVKLRRAHGKRRYGPCESHIIFKLQIQKHDLEQTDSNLQTNSLYLVELASAVQPVVPNVTKRPTDSLIQLFQAAMQQKVLQKLQSSTLPRVFRGMLLPKTTLLLLITASPTSNALHETLESLKFGQTIHNMRVNL